MNVVVFTTFLLATNIVGISVAFLIYTAGLTRRASYVQRLGQSKATKRASIILRDLEEPYHRFLEDGGFDNSYFYNNNMMPLLLQEAQGIAKTSGDVPGLLLFGIFLSTYAIVWTKTRIKANRDDLRSLIGTEILLQRATA